MKDGDARTMTRREKFSTNAINATDGGALTMATKAKRVRDAEKESSNVRRLTRSHISPGKAGGLIKPVAPQRGWKSKTLSC